MKNIVSLIGMFVIATAIAFVAGPVFGAIAGVGLSFAQAPKGSLAVNGFRPAVLDHLKTIAGVNTPQLKLEPLGFLGYLAQAPQPEVLRINTGNGHRKTATVKYKQRWTKDFTDTAKSCDNTNQSVYHEAAIELASTRQIAFHIPDETIARYTDDASRTVRVGQPATDLMNEFLEDIMIATNALLEAVNDDLLTVLSTSFGVNRRTGSNAAATLNINKDGSINPLDDGITRLLTDYKLNRFMGRPDIIGAGLMHAHVLQQGAKSFDQSGLDTKLLANQFNFWYDLGVDSILGANQVAVVAPGSLGLVQYLEYTGFKAGVKPGQSEFGTLVLPMQIGSEVRGFKVDFQLRYNDCAETVTDAYYGTSLTLEKGYNLILSSQTGLFTLPSDSYRATDVLNGNRGTLRYTISNDCETCS